MNVCTSCMCTVQVNIGRACWCTQSMPQPQPGGVACVCIQAAYSLMRIGAPS